MPHLLLSFRSTDRMGLCFSGPLLNALTKCGRALAVTRQKTELSEFKKTSISRLLMRVGVEVILTETVLYLLK